MRKTKFARLSGIFFLVIFLCGFSISSIAQTVNNSGTITLKGNLVNQSVTQSNLGTGTIEFTGTTEQTISGQNLMGNLTVNKASGRLVIGGNTQVNGHLTLTNGRVSLGANNLLLGPSADVVGTITAANMVVAIGSGELRKSWSGNGSFIFPVGDTTSTAEYSPVTLNFTSGTYPANNYIGVSLKNQAYNTTLYTGSYLNRYWVVTNTSGAPISNFTCDATFKYTDSDVSGTESELYCTKVALDPVVTYAAADVANNLLTAAGLTSFSTFTGTKGGVTVRLLAYIEGPYNSSTNLMNTTLRDAGKVPLNQPYNTPPWNYSGTESVAAVPADVVDWILIQLRQAGAPSAANSSTIISTKVAFLKKDGSIVDLDGASDVKFYNAAITNNLYPVILHRNHIAIMANNAVTKTSGIYLYNFTTGQSQIYDGSGNGCINIGGSGIYGMISGNGDGNGTINNTDFLRWQTNFASSTYNPGDFNLTGTVNNTDFILWQRNFAKSTKVP